jgi:RimJ/RimL family protein N-acetyltransferase
MSSTRIPLIAGFFLSDVFLSDDIDQLVLYLNEPDVYNNTLSLPNPYTTKDAQNFISLSNQKNAEFGRKLTLHIRNAERKLIGGISILGNYGKTTHKEEIGYWLAKPYWNQGIMTETIKAFVNYVLENKEIKRIEARTFEHNISSQRVLEKCNFEYEGIMKKAFHKNGKYYNAKQFALVID